MESRNICVFDFETTGLNPQVNEICQIGAVMIERNQLKVIDRFESLVQPTDWENVEEEALKVNGLTKEQLLEAPETPIVWQNFASWIAQYRIDNKAFFAPIPAGYNINGFDLKFVNSYCMKYGPYDEKYKRQALFSDFMRYDVMDLMAFFTESNRDIGNMRLTTVLEYMGVPKTELNAAHNAVWDAEQTARILIKLLKLSRYLGGRNSETNKRRLEFAGALINE